MALQIRTISLHVLLGTPAHYEPVWHWSNGPIMALLLGNKPIRMITKWTRLFLMPPHYSLLFPRSHCVSVHVHIQYGCVCERACVYVLMYIWHKCMSNERYRNMSTLTSQLLFSCLCFWLNLHWFIHCWNSCFNKHLKTVAVTWVDSVEISEHGSMFMDLCTFIVFLL